MKRAERQPWRALAGAYRKEGTADEEEAILCSFCQYFDCEVTASCNHPTPAIATTGFVVVSFHGEDADCRGFRPMAGRTPDNTRQEMIADGWKWGESGSSSFPEHPKEG